MTNAVAVTLTRDTLGGVKDGTRHLSASQIAMFERCSLQYYYRYILNWSERPSLNLANGKAGHTAVEFALNTKKDTERLPPLDAVLDSYNDAFKEELTKFSPPDFLPEDDPNAIQAGTNATLTKYHREEAPLVTPVLIEQAFTLQIPPAEEDGFEVPPLVGRMDLVSDKLLLPDKPEHHVTEPTTVRALTDNKFARRLKSTMDANLSDQLTIYDMVLANAGLPTDRLGFDLFIPPNKSGEPKVQTVWRAPEWMTPEVREARYQRLMYKIRVIEKQIQRQEFKPTDNAITCSWCGYNTVCQDSKVDRWTALAMRQKGATE